MRRAALLLILGSLVFAGSIALAGCGDEEEASPTPETITGTVTTETEETETETDETETTETGEEEPSEGDPVAGKTVFVANCGTCHVLADAGTSGTIGPNLDDSQPDSALVVDRVTNGQGLMPPFGDSLSETEIADVAAYVVDATS
jgi:mono/diheme cytochrome c family protein